MAGDARVMFESFEVGLEGGLGLRVRVRVSEGLEFRGVHKELELRLMARRARERPVEPSRQTIGYPHFQFIMMLT
eukprot:1331102-Amorphochlora_amoeboformis.AAC.1